CATNIGYYVIIGNEIVRPIRNAFFFKVLNYIDQVECANLCSMNQGLNHEEIACRSLNYFPLTRKCELYSILAEPHGPGNLVQNENVIYAEKFCIPDSNQRCQSDEVFILHVQKSISRFPIRHASSPSITACVKLCLSASFCK
ncbi:hypothetical protein Angca_003775, partial [Angiostrongylus cantonensis]